MKTHPRRSPTVMIEPAAFDTRGAANYTGSSISYLNKARMDPLPPELVELPPGPEWFRFGRSIRYTRKALDKWIAQIELIAPHRGGGAI